MRRFLFGIALGIVVTLAAQAYVGGIRVTLPFVSVAAVTPSPTLPAAVGQQLTAVQQALTQAKQERKPVPVTITLTEQQLTAAAAAYFPLTYAGASLSDPVVHLRDGQLRLDSAASLAIVRTTASVITTPTATAGRPSVRVESATLGGQALPDAAKQALAADIASAIAAGVPANLVVSSIAVGAGTLTVQGTANP